MGPSHVCISAAASEKPRSRPSFSEHRSQDRCCNDRARLWHQLLQPAAPCTHCDGPAARERLGSPQGKLGRARRSPALLLRPTSRPCKSCGTPGRFCKSASRTLFLAPKGLRFVLQFPCAATAAFAMALYASGRDMLPGGLGRFRKSIKLKTPRFPLTNSKRTA